MVGSNFFRTFAVTNRIRMQRHLFILIGLLLLSGSARAGNALYGSKSTDLYANASYRHQDGNEEYVTLHMTNRFDDRNKLPLYIVELNTPLLTKQLSMMLGVVTV